MKAHTIIARFVCTAFTMLLLFSAAGQAAAADIVVFGVDPPGVGVNDPTPATPVGGNPGTTLGDQRLNVFNFAAQLWGSVIESNNTIYVAASFAPLPCAPTGGVLGSAGTTFVFRDFVGAPSAGTWYHSSLSDALAGGDLNPGFFDIGSTFNSDIDDDDPNCLTGRTWY